MQIWERERLEYKPKLTYARKVMANIQSQVASGELEIPPVFSKPLQRLLDVTGHDILANTAATLSKANDIKKSLDKCLSDYPRYQAYQQAKQANDVDEMNTALAASARDINGRSQMDVIPLLEDMYNSMEHFMDYVNQSLFDGKADYNNLDLVEDEESKMLDELFDREMKGEPIDYLVTSLRSKKLLAFRERAESYKYIINKIDSFLLLSEKDILKDVESALRFVVSQSPEDQSVLLDIYKAGFDSAADSVIDMMYTAQRLSDEDFRQMIDDMLAKAEQKTLQAFPTIDRLDRISTDEAGVNHLLTTLSAGSQIIKSSVDNIVTEHINTSSSMCYQARELFKGLQTKRTNQLMHQLVDRAINEISPKFLEKDIKRFVEKHGVYSPATYCR